MEGQEVVCKGSVKSGDRQVVWKVVDVVEEDVLETFVHTKLNYSIKNAINLNQPQQRKYRKFKRL